MGNIAKIDPQRITTEMRERVEAISWDADQIDVLMDLLNHQVFNLKTFLRDSKQLSIETDDWRIIMALINLARRELERIKEASEEFSNFEFKDGVLKKVRD